MWQSMEILNVFNSLTLKQIFWKTKKPFSKNCSIVFKLGALRFKNASSPYKTAISEANVKTNRMESTKWTYHKERSFISEYFIFFSKFCLGLVTSYKELTWCTNTQMPIIVLFVSARILFDDAFSLWVSVTIKNLE